MTHRRKWIQRATLLAGTLVGLSTGEVAIRVLRPQPLPSQDFARGLCLKGMYVADEKAGYRLAPRFRGRLEPTPTRVTSFTTNSLGLRDRELGEKYAPRIAAFGDSMTWGWAVEQGQEWIAVAGQELGRRFQREVETVNCGVCGYGTENELGLLESLGHEIRPDVVLLGFFPNDFVDNVYGRDAYTIREGYLFDDLTHRFLHEGIVARRSHLWRLLLHLRGAAEARHAGVGEADRLQAAFFLARRPAPHELRASGARTVRLIVQMQQAARALGARFAVVWLPLDWQVLEPGEDMTLDVELHRVVAAAGIPSLDPLGVLRAEPEPAGLYLGEGDTHFTVRGHRRVGESVARWLVESGLLHP